MYDTSQKRLGRTVGGEALLAEIPNERQAAREQRLGFFFNSNIHDTLENHTNKVSCPAQMGNDNLLIPINHQPQHQNKDTHHM